MLVSQHPHVSDVFLAVLQIPDTLVFHVAGLAPRLADPSLAILEAELLDRLLDAAPSAGTRLGSLHRTCILSLAGARNNHISSRIQTTTRDSSRAKRQQLVSR